MSKLIHGKIRLTTSQSIILGFFSMILLGTFLLMLPFSSRAGDLEAEPSDRPPGACLHPVQLCAVYRHLGRLRDRPCGL